MNRYMNRIVASLVMISVSVFSCVAMALADEPTRVNAESAAYSEAQAQLTSAGMAGSTSAVITDGKDMGLAIRLGMLDGDSSVALFRLSAQARVLDSRQTREAEEAAAAAASAAADVVAARQARLDLLREYDGVMISCGDSLHLRAAPGGDAAVLRSIKSGKVARLLDATEDGWYQVTFGTATGYISAEYCKPVHYADYAGTAAVSTVNEELPEFAYTYLGTPYVYGGVSYSGIDCSGFTMKVFAQFGYSLPHSATAQYYLSSHISDAERESGDLVFFTGADGGIEHVGIYLGGGRFIHASSSRGVIISSLSESYYARNYLFAGRILSD